MPRKYLCLLAIVCTATIASSCSKELKPDRKGVFIASGGTLTELRSVTVDTEFTDEGFAITYFTADPPKVKQGDFYFILYGQYQVSDLKAYVRNGGRWQIDTSQTGLNTKIEALGMKDEPEMHKCRFRVPIGIGTYALEAQQGGSTLFFPFVVSTGM